jgi:hypothetical protein
MFRKLLLLSFMSLLGSCGVTASETEPPSGGVRADMGFPAPETKWVPRFENQTGASATITYTVLGEGTYEGKSVYRVSGGTDTQVYDKATGNMVAILRMGKEAHAFEPHEGPWNWLNIKCPVSLRVQKFRLKRASIYFLTHLLKTILAHDWAFDSCGVSIRISVTDPLSIGMQKDLGGDPDFFSLMVLFPSATFSTRLAALSFLKFISATISVFQIKRVAASPVHPTARS